MIEGGEGTDKLYVQGSDGLTIDLAAAGIESAYGNAGDDSFDGSALTENSTQYGRDRRRHPDERCRCLTVFTAKAETTR